MSTTASSRSNNAPAFAAPGTPTLADVLLAVSAASGLHDRANVLSAVNTVARVLGLPPDAITAHPSFLRRRLAQAAPAAHGLGARRWSNIRSLLRRALAIAGVDTLPGRYMSPLTSAWTEMATSLPDTELKYGLSRFTRYCSAAGIAPDAVDDDVLDKFRRALEEESLIRKTDKLVRRTILYWNRAIALVAGWPKQRLSQGPGRTGYVLHLAAFPTSLQEDVEGYLRRLAGEDPLEEHAFRPVKQSTIEQRRFQIRMLASALVRRGRAPGDFVSLRNLVQLEAVKEGLRFFLERNGNRRTTQVLGVAQVALAIARHWVRLPDPEIEQLRRLVRRCKPFGEGMTAKNRATIRQFDDEATVRRLLDLPRILAARVSRSTITGERQALVLQYAVAMELLIHAPMRIGNLAGLRLDQHFQRIGTGARKVVIVIPADEVKNGVELTYPLPPETAELLATYLAEAHPLLTTDGSMFLFPGRKGRHKQIITLRSKLRAIIEKEIGLRVTPHQFRHIAARIYLKAEPGGHEVVRALLAHKSINTTIASYAGMEQADAVRHYDKMIERLRRVPGDRA